MCIHSTRAHRCANLFGEKSQLRHAGKRSEMHAEAERGEEERAREEEEEGLRGGRRSEFRHVISEIEFW